MAGSCSSPGTLNCGSVPHWHLSPGNPVFDITCIPKHHLHAAYRQAASTFYQSSFCICSFFCVCMCVLSPSFEESPGSDSNEYVSFAGVFQSRIWESMNIFCSYASCHISGIVPCLAWDFFSLFIFYSFLPCLAVVLMVICYTYCILFFSVPWWYRIAFLNFESVVPKGHSRPLYCWTPKMFDSLRGNLTFQIQKTNLLIWSNRNRD